METSLYRSLLFVTCLIIRVTEGAELQSIQATPKGQGQGQGHLEHMVVDEVRGHLFIGGSDVVHVLSTEDLQSVKKIATGPLADSLYCPPHPTVECLCPLPDEKNPECENYKRTNQTNINKALAIDEQQGSLLACGNLYFGFCQRVSLEELEIVESMYEPVVGADGQHMAVMFLAPGSTPQGALYVGVSSVTPDLTAFTQRIPMMSSRDPRTLGFVKPTSFVDMSSGHQFTFVDGFSYNGFSYFVINTATVTKIARVCQKDSSYRSYIEMTMQCSIKGVSYTTATDVTMGTLGAKLATSLDKTVDADAVFVSYQKEGTPSSALCVYTTESIEDIFHQTIVKCFQGDGKLGPEQLTAASSLCTPTTYNISQAYCGEHSENAYIDGQMTVIPTALVGPIPDAHVTAVVVKTYGKQTIAYLGTEIGDLLELVVQGYKQWEMVTLLTLTSAGEDKKVKVMSMSADGDSIFALSVLTVHKLQTSTECGQHTTCDTCSQADPHCGWCLATKTCVPFESCIQTSSVLAAAIGYLDDCPTVKTVSPQSISVNSLKQDNSFTVELNLPISGNVSCVVNASNKFWTVTATLSPGGAEVLCDSFSHFPAFLRPDENHLVANLSIASNVDFTPAEITIYDCSTISSCTECAEASYPCQGCAGGQFTHPCAWCPTAHQCVSRSSVTQCLAAPPSASSEQSGDGDKLSDMNLIPVETGGNQGNDTVARVRRAVDNTIEDSSKCPQVALPALSELLRAHANKFLDVRLDVVNLLPYQKPLRCLFHLPGDQLETKDGNIISTDGAITRVQCDRVVLDYTSTDASITVPVTIVWDDSKQLDSPQPITVEVYKCSQMAETCGNCGTLDSAYKCYWCGSQCAIQDQCTALGDKVARNATCPGPEITKFSPANGPVWGGTPVTVVGVNLGKQASDVQAWIGGVACSLLEDQYQAAVSFVCLTGKSQKAKFSMIEISIDGKYNTTSNQQFAYLQATAESVSPSQGPVSGGTIATLDGRHLDIASDVQVTINRVQSQIEATNATHITFLTPRQSGKMDGKIEVYLDTNVVTSPFLKTFRYLDDPVITEVKPLGVFVSGRAEMSVSGSNLDTVSQPQLVIYTDTGSVETDCVNVTSSHMTCHVPDLSPHDLVLEPTVPLALDFGFIMDGVTETQRLNDLPQFSPLLVYMKPIVHPFDDVIKVKPDMVLTITGERLDVVEGMVVTVGSSECAIVSVNSTTATCLPPKEPAQLDKNKRAVVMVRLGHYQSIPGHVSYASDPMDHISMGIIMGIAVGAGILVLGVILFCVICWCKYRHGNKNKRDSVFAPDTNHAGSPRDGMDIEMEAIHPKQNLRPQISSPVAVKVPDAAGNYKDATATAAERAPLTVGETNSLTGDDFVPGAATEDELTDGDADAGDDSDEWDEEEPEYSNMNFELTGLLEHLGDDQLKRDVKQVYIPRDRLQLGEILGKGHFGCVFSAKLRDSNLRNPTQVAVKTVQGSNLDQTAIESFLKEGVIMKNFEHPHILNLLGVCIDNKNPMMVLPYMAQGDLRSYVKDKKKNFTARQLLQLAQQVAEGMAYLSALNFVHRDLAARNCMIDDQNVVKVADFGLSRDTYERDYFHSKDKKGKLPIKWMALESLQNLIFTSKSDVWSFGILLWELMTRGVSPYPDVDAFDVRDYLASGRRLYQPKYCPDNVYKIMLACWQENPKKRPTFTDLVNTMELMLNPPPKRVTPEEEEEPMYMNVTRPESGEYHLDGVPIRQGVRPPLPPVPT